MPVAAQTPSRPQITGISHLAVYASDLTRTGDYYMKMVGCTIYIPSVTAQGFDYFVNGTQFIEVLPIPPSAGNDRLDHIAFTTTDVDGLRRYLLSKGVTAPASVSRFKSGVQWIEVKDFEGNSVQFVGKLVMADGGHAAVKSGPVGNHIIHIGMMIRDRAAADRFYRDILGFRLYWHGGMKPDKTDWVAMQVPDGTDWLEYMLTSGPSGSGVPASISQKSLGVLNHLSIGVPNMAKAVATLKSEHRVGPEGTGPQIGKDGKWQFNDFDPDETRLEYMEFTPVQQPCCAPFTGPHPSPSGH
jgi:catechol 2,3-dioxygenase-like lactoylglutathione lyase family enzyme